jgi:PKD repeat protein
MLLKPLKSILMILAFGLSFSVQAQCSYTLTLLDSYGDGWNGNSMYAQTSGYSPSTLTLSTGSTISYQISITTGDTLTFGWLGGGQWQSECSFTVTDNATGTTVYTSPAGNLMSTTSPQYTVVCTLTSNSTPCLYNTPYTESFSGAGGGWVAPTSQFNIGSINGCWDRGVYSTYNWIKAPSPSSSLANATGPSGDHTNGGSGYLSCDPYFFATAADSSTLITPYISLANDSAPQVSFWYHLFGSDIKRLEIAITTDTASNWTVIDSLFPNTGAFVSSSSPWHQAIYSIADYIDDTVAFKFTAFRDLAGLNSGSNSRISIDDFAITEDTLGCKKPIKVRLTALSLGNAQITWDTTGATYYQVQWSQGTTAPNTGNIALVTNNQYNLNGLAPNSSYTLRVRSLCGTSDTSAWSEFITIETLCGYFIAPWSEDFEGNDWVAPLSWFDQGDFGDCFLDSGSLGFYWKVARGPKSTDEGPNTDHTPTGNGKFLATNYRYGSTAPDNLSFTTPWITLNLLTNPELKFWLHAFSNAQPTNGFPVQFGKFTATVEQLNGSKTAVFDTSGALQGSQTSPWKEIVIPLSYSSSDTIRITFSYDGVSLVQGQPFSIDDISVASAPSCPRPRFPKVLSVSTTDALLKWNTGGANYHQLRYKKVNANNWNVVSTSNTQFLLTALDPNTKYRWEVRDSCSSTDKSVWVKGPSFFTSCSIFTAPYTNSFSNNQWQGPSSFRPSGQIGNCFTRFEDDNDGYFWTGARSGFDHFAFTGPQTDHTGGSSGYLFARANSATSDTANIELPPVFLGQLLSPEFSFWYHMYGNSIGGLNVYARSPGGSDTLISSFTGAQQSGGAAWLKNTTSLSTFLGDTVVITLQAIKTSGSSFFTYSSAVCIDDIAFEGTLNCPAPTLLTASSITTNTATLTWQGTSSISIIEYGPTGFTLGTGQLINPATSPYTLTGLIPNTSYSVFVKDSCGVNLLSSNATLNFNTPNCPAVTAQGSVTLNGSTVSALNTGSPSDSILWLWGNGANSTGSSPIYTYPTPGIYTVQQVASNYCGNSDTLTFTLTVCGSVVSQFAVAGNGQTKVFNAGASIGAGLSYSWNFGDGFTSTGSNPTHSFANPGVYIVNLVVTDACGIAASSSQNVSICNTVQPSFTRSAASALSFNFSAQPAGLSSYSWDFGDGTTASGAMTSHTYGSAGTFAVTLTCTDTCGGSYTFVDTVSTCPALTANFTFNIASSGANGMLVQFFANVSGSSGLIWDWGDGTQSITQATSISHQYATVSLNFTITLSAYNECGDTIQVIKSLNEVGLPEQRLLKYTTYPNPVSGALTIEFSTPLDGTYYLYDVTGRLVRSERFKERAFVIFPTSNLSRGSYILKVESNQQVKNSIIFKQ